MVKIKLALCQMNVIDDKKANLDEASSMIARSMEKNADFIILPEMFNCPYSNDKFIEYGEEERGIKRSLFLFFISFSDSSSAW